MPKKYLGIDIGGTKCAVIRGDGNANIEEKIKFDTTDVNTTVAKIVSAAMTLKTEDVVACGISCGGPLDSEHGLILSPPNLKDWDRINIVKICEDALRIPCRLCNDANACALAEWVYGAGRGTRNMVFLTNGTGMGAGLILNGKLYSGTNDNAGECGHIRLKEDGPEGYYKNGSFEGFCSGGGIAKIGISEAEKALKKGITPSYWTGDPKDVTAKAVCLAAESGDRTAKKVINISAKMLGRGLSVICDLLNPERVVIGSIYQRSGKLFQKAMMKELKKEALPQSLSVMEIVPAELGDNIGDIAALTIARLIENE